MNEYVIVNKTAILKRIEELKESLVISEAHNDKIRAGIETFEIKQLEWCLSQSTPLIPEIEKSWEHGYTRGYNLACCEGVNSECLTPDKQDYISNLKLNI